MTKTKGKSRREFPRGGSARRSRGPRAIYAVHLIAAPQGCPNLPPRGSRNGSGATTHELTSAAHCALTSLRRAPVATTPAHPPTPPSLYPSPPLSSSPHSYHFVYRRSRFPPPPPPQSGTHRGSSAPLRLHSGSPVGGPPDPAAVVTAAATAVAAAAATQDISGRRGEARCRLCRCYHCRLILGPLAARTLPPLLLLPLPTPLLVCVPVPVEHVAGSSGH